MQACCLVIVSSFAPSPPPCPAPCPAANTEAHRCVLQLPGECASCFYCVHAHLCRLAVSEPHTQDRQIEGQIAKQAQALLWTRSPTHIQMYHQAATKVNAPASAGVLLFAVDKLINSYCERHKLGRCARDRVGASA